MYKLLSMESERQKVLIDAGLSEFAKRGYDDASTNVIAKAAGLSKPLMFHYIGSKKEFFLFLYDTCMTRLKEHYFNLIDHSQTDILVRLRKAYLLKIRAMHDWPLEFAFVNSTVLSPPKSEAAEELLEKQSHYVQDANRDFYSDADVTLFKSELDSEKSLELIAWSVYGFAENVLKRESQSPNKPDLNAIGAEFDSYLAELRKAYYR